MVSCPEIVVSPSPCTLTLCMENSCTLFGPSPAFSPSGSLLLLRCLLHAACQHCAYSVILCWCVYSVGNTLTQDERNHHLLLAWLKKDLTTRQMNVFRNSCSPVSKGQPSCSGMFMALWEVRWPLFVMILPSFSSVFKLCPMLKLSERYPKN